VFSWPADDKLRISGLDNRVVAAYALTNRSHPLIVNYVNGTPVIALPSRRPDQYDTVIAVELDGPPRVAAPTVVQGSDAPFELDYISGVTAGKAMKRFNRDGKFHIAKWTGPEDSITWRVLISQTGKYNVRIRYSARQESHDEKYLITISSQTVTGAVVPTGEGYQYRTFDLGTVQLSKAGFATVQIKPAAEYNHNLMFFQTLELIPVGPRMIE
jgi:hypothetical protein